MHAGTHYGISSQPHIIPDRNLFSVFKSGIACVRINRMSCRINRHIGSHLAVITDFYFCHIYDRAVIVCEKIPAYLNM